MFKQTIERFSSRTGFVLLGVLAALNALLLHDTHLDKVALVAIASYATPHTEKMTSDPHTHIERQTLRNMLERESRPAIPTVKKKQTARENDRLKKQYHFPR